MLDLSSHLKRGIELLNTWEKRYSHYDYPEKIALNIFYKKYTMQFIFPELLNSFEEDGTGKPLKKWEQYTIGANLIVNLFENTAKSKTVGILEYLLKTDKKDVGHANYHLTIPMIKAVQDGDNSILAELEYLYLYYCLIDDCIMMWAALGGTGLTKIQAASNIGGFVVAEEIKSYAQIEDLFGKHFVIFYLRDNYKPIPSTWLY